MVYTYVLFGDALRYVGNDIVLFLELEVFLWLGLYICLEIFLGYCIRFLGGVWLVV